MRIEDLTIGQAREIARTFSGGGSPSHSLRVGDAVLIDSESFKCECFGGYLRADDEGRPVDPNGPEGGE